MATVNNNSDAGVRRPRYVNTAKASVTTTAYHCRTISSRRRSNRSASTPANKAKMSVEPRLAVWTSATMTAVLCISTENHCAATFCIQVPRFETELGDEQVAEDAVAQRRPCRGLPAVGMLSCLNRIRHPQTPIASRGWWRRRCRIS